MNALYAVDKPIGISSNSFLMRLKKQNRWKKCGYSGTLDPFASGLLIIGVGAYTKLFPFLDKRVKTYEATLWLGAESESLDIEQVANVKEIPAFSIQEVENALYALQGKISYTPPKFSAKHINGQRAYELAREGIEFELRKSEMEIFELKLLAYCHPFISFRVSVSEGGYIRSLGEMIADQLKCKGCLSYLRRISEGRVKLPLRGEMENIEALEALGVQRVDLSAFKNEIFHGKKLRLPDLVEGVYYAVFEDFFSIIEIYENNQVRYLLNRIPKC